MSLSGRAGPVYPLSLSLSGECRQAFLRLIAGHIGERLFDGATVVGSLLRLPSTIHRIVFRLRAYAFRVEVDISGYIRGRFHVFVYRKVI